jgi:hypothetical protein
MKDRLPALRLFACIIVCGAWHFGPRDGFSVAFAEDAKNDIARIIAIEPVAVISGTKATLKVRGFKLKEASAVRFPMATEVKWEIKEKKDSDPPKGLENKTVGDTQLLAEVTLPSELPPGTLEYVIETSSGNAVGKLLVLAANAVAEEAEPNNGFHEAQSLSLGVAARGSIQGDKDVDVFAVPCKSGQRLKVSVITGGPLLIDAALDCYDSGGQFLASSDDGTSRDPELLLTVPKDESVFLCVSGAHDIGGEWHSYLLVVEEVK